MKKLLLLILAVVGVAGLSKAQVYPINFDIDATSTHVGSYSGATTSNPSGDARYTYAVGIEDGDTIAIATRACGAMYYDKTSEALNVWVGAGSFVPYLHFHGVWMHRYVYIDWNNDGQFGDGEDPGDELVVHAGVQSNGDLSPFDAITIPEGTPAGTYYIRFKVEWNVNNPGGGANIIPNGGVIVDTRLVLTDEKPDVPINVTPEDGDFTNEDANSLYDAIYKSNGVSDGTKSNASGRYIQSITLNGKAISVSSSGTSRPMYYNFLNSNDYFEILPGTSYTPVRTWTGQWMHHYMYIDYNQDGVYANGSATTQDDEELVSYTYCDGVNKLGESASNNGSAAFTAFTVPGSVGPGVYALRVKQDWDWLDPTARTQKEGNNFQGNGGQIVDFRVVVHEPEVFLSAASSVVDEEGNPIENTGASVKLFRPTKGVKADGASVQVGSDELTEGDIAVTYGQATSLVVAPESTDYLLSEVKVQYGYNLDDPQYKAGIKQWDEVDLTSSVGDTGGTINLSSAVMKSADVRVKVKTTPNPITAIGQVEVEKPAADVIYDLQGRRVLKADKGIYIINGQKVLF